MVQALFIAPAKLPEVSAAQTVYQDCLQLLGDGEDNWRREKKKSAFAFCRSHLGNVEVSFSIDFCIL